MNVSLERVTVVMIALVSVACSVMPVDDDRSGSADDESANEVVEGDDSSRAVADDPTESSAVDLGAIRGLTASTGPSFTFVGANDFTMLVSTRPIFSLQWSAPTGTTCVASGAWSGTKLATNTEKVSKPGVYRLTCSNASGSAYKDVTVSCAVLSSGGLNILGDVCTVCPGLTTGNGLGATCELNPWKTGYHICEGIYPLMGAPYCGDGPIPTPLPAPACTYTYSAWGACTNGAQTRTALTVTPSGCSGSPVTTQACTSSPAPTPTPTPTPAPAPVTVTLKANGLDATNCSKNKTFRLSWSVSPAAATCVATTGDWSPSKGNPQDIVFAGTSAKTYGIKCTYNGVSASDTVTVSPR